MTKPANAMELSVPADLSETSFEDAYKRICKFDGYYVLRVPSQLMGLATVMRLHAQYTIDIDFLYHPDEWSLHRMFYNIDTQKNDEKCVWSPGA